MNDIFRSAGMARKYWLEHELDKYDFVLLLPGGDEPCDAGSLGFRIRAEFEKKLGSRRGLVVYGPDADMLIDLYSLYAFTDKLIVGSFALPYGRKLHCLLNYGNATEDILINDVLLSVME